MLNKIAITHPGKLGDALYTLPAVRWLCEKHNKKADFWTSEYCLPLKKLFEYQSCIDKFYVSPSYRISNMNMGVQPWFVPVINESEYERVYHLGFLEFPNTHIPDYICAKIGASSMPIKYEYPEIPTLKEDYIVIAPRGERRWIPIIENLVQKCNVVQIGALGDKVTTSGIDKTGLDFLETTAWIANAKVFIGCKSSQLVLAEGFPIPCFVDSVLERDVTDILGLNCYNKCLDTDDYRWLHEGVPHIDQVASKGFPHSTITDYNRRWEYGMAIRLNRYYGKTLLDVCDFSRSQHTAASLLTVAASWIGKEVTVVDPLDCQRIIDAQNSKLVSLNMIHIKYNKTDFMDFPEDLTYDTVTCISVLEHIQDDEDFFQKLCKHVNPKGLLFLTVDFSSNEEPLKFYNEKKIKNLISKANGFKIHGSTPNYELKKETTFASICLKKVDHNG